MLQTNRRAYCGITALCVVSHGKNQLTVVGVAMPFLSGQTRLYCKNYKSVKILPSRWIVHMTGTICSHVFRWYFCDEA